MIYHCCSLNRKNAILENSANTPNGIDYLEVADTGTVIPTSPPYHVSLPQQTLLLYCLKPLTSALTPGNVMITGGESITDITVTSVTLAAGPPHNLLVVQTNKPGDFSTYLLRLVDSKSQAAENSFDVTEVLPGFDPQLAEVQFSFKIECGPDFDCAPQSPVCSQDSPAPPSINYLAKDYGSFRTLILDRLNQLLPAWGGTSEADLGVALAELIAYRCDHLSYQQDAIATEAYIETARSRVSLRRHARLVDYHVHDGCNARTWIRLTVAANSGEAVFLDRGLTRFYTYAPGMPANLAVGAGNEEAALLSGVQVFESMQDGLLYSDHNQMFFYTWGETECCLPQGAMESTLNGYFPNLQPGDVLIFQEVTGPQTGNAADADLRRRCAVRLTQVATLDANGNRLVDPLFDQYGNPVSATGKPASVTEIQWSADDALPFPICISSIYLDSTGTRHFVANVSVAFGNVVLADYGVSVFSTKLKTVPPPRLRLPADPAGNRCEPALPVTIPARYRPVIPDSPITQAVPQLLAGLPVAPNVVLLGETGSANLTDSNGLVCLTVQTTSPASWPELFGVLVKQNPANPENFDLSLVYHPLGGENSSSTLVTLESFTNLSLKAADPNYVTLQINTLSRLVRVPSNYVPPTTAPSGYPGTPVMLPNSGSVNLQALGNPPATYLTLQTTPPTAWPQALGVLVRESQQDLANLQPQPEFDLAVVYFPPSGGVGVTLPVTLEQFSALSRINISSQLNSRLVTVNSFTGSPDLGLAASNLVNFDATEAVPEITLQGTLDGITNQWQPAQDLLEATQLDRVFVVEVESDGTASLRFATPPDPGTTSETTNGMVPESGTNFVATYRIGNGTAGNVGAESLIHLAAVDARIQSCTNPLPATGGIDPETDDQIRRRAPQAFLSQDPSTLQRSVTMADYQALAETNPQVDQAVASLRWTGSWYSVFIAVQPKGGGNLTSSLQNSLEKNVNRFRFAGQDLQLESPEYVALQIELMVCVDPSYFQSDVEHTLLQVLGNQILPNGRKGLFYPDNFTFGQTVFLSPVYAAARSVPGVTSVTASRFQPQGVNSNQYLVTGQIKLGSLQVARLDNDPSFPDHGQLTLIMQGGK